MAERRMFAKTIIDSDAFLDMPISARLLYYDLCMRADDDGFVNSPKKIMRMTGVSDDDIKLLAIKKFIIPFENGVIVIKHWRIHNYIRKDTYKQTTYKEQLNVLSFDENNAYTVDAPKITESRRRPVDDPSTQVRLGKDRLGKDSKDKKGDFISEIVSQFQQAYFEASGLEYHLTNKNKERGCCGKILKLYKQKYPDSDSEETLRGLRAYFDAVCRIEDTWLSNNMSPCLILNKFNEINKILTNGSKKSGGATTNEIASVVAKHFSTDN